MATEDRKSLDALRREIEADAHVARVRDYGAEDAATYDQRVREGAQMPVTEHRHESDDQREDRYWEIVGSGAYFPEGWNIPRLTTPSESSKPDAVDRARTQVEALKSADFESMHPPEHGKTWDELSEWAKFDNLRHWVDWDGVSRADRAQLIGGQLDAYELAVARIPSHEYRTAIDMPELMELWERLDPANQINGTPDQFDRIVADLPRQWHRDGHADSGETWEEWNAVEKIGYLAEHGARHNVSFERFVDAASRTLGLSSWEEFTTDDEWHLLEQYRDTVERHRRDRGQDHDTRREENRGEREGDGGREGADVMRNVTDPQSDYLEALHAAAERGSGRAKGKEGPER